MILTSISRLKLQASEEDIHIMVLTKGVQIFLKSETSELKKPTLTPECLKQPP